MKLTRKKLRKLIQEAVTSAIRKYPRKRSAMTGYHDLQDYRHHGLQLPPIPSEVGHHDFDDEMIEKM